MKIYKIDFKLLVGLFVGAAVFIVAAQLSQQYSEPLQAITSQTGWVGILSYISIMILSIVVAPLSTGFLVPVAANSFGPFLAALYSITGWTIGSIIAFALARYAKQTALQEVTFIEYIHEYEQKLPRWYFYSLIVMLRIALPVDVLSYVLGIASTISMRAFFITTVIGITPFAFIFTYASQGAIWIQITVALVSIIVFLVGVLFVKQKFFNKR